MFPLIQPIASTEVTIFDFEISCTIMFNWAKQGSRNKKSNLPDLDDVAIGRHRTDWPPLSTNGLSFLMFV